jgi:GMP synthase (glutamine-hydrolysing)
MGTTMPRLFLNLDNTVVRSVLWFLIAVLMLAPSINAAAHAGGTVLIVDTERLGKPNTDPALIRDALLKLGVKEPRIIHYSQIAEAARKWAPRAVILSGQATRWADYDPAELNEITSFLKTTRLPVLGICGGHQLLAIAFGGKVGLIGEKAGTEIRNKGWFRISLDRSDPLFASLPAEPRLWFNHREEVKAAPQGFESICLTPGRKLYAFRKGRTVYGVQFHPEIAGDGSGAIVLSNFLKIAGL